MMAYNPKFLGYQNPIDFPKISEDLSMLLQQKGLKDQTFYLDYTNFSLFQHPFRKLPLFTIANIDGKKFKKVPRKDAWAKDKRIAKNLQFGSELYTAEKSDFDKGHMTKREDVQWGDDEDEALAAAMSTYFYTNAVPQVDRLNRGVWSRIEKYILHSEAVERQEKITLITGPVLGKNDPEFVTKVEGETVLLPVYFWKIVYYLSREGSLHKTAFIVSQLEILRKRRIVKPLVRGIVDEFYMDFKAAETYQTRTELIEELTKLTFPEALEIYKDDRPTKLILEDTQVRGVESSDDEYIIIKNLVL